MRLVRAPCPACKEDTLHAVLDGLQCITCKTVTARPAQMRTKAYMRHAIRVSKGQSPRLDRKVHAAAARASRESTPTSILEGRGRRPK